VGLRPLALWDCGFESSLGHKCLYLDSVVSCQVEVSATSRSLILRSPSECKVYLTECDLEISKREKERDERRGGQVHKGLSSYKKNYSYLHPCCCGGGNDDDCDDNTAKPPNMSYTCKIRALTYPSCQSCCKIFSEELDTADHFILTALIDPIGR
jgi:hypothetical protein